MFGITATQVGSFVRSAIIFAGGYFVNKGLLDADMVITIAGAVSTFSVAAYGMYLRSKGNLVSAAITATAPKALY